MFSGLVEEVGKVLGSTDTPDGRSLQIAATVVTSQMRTGDSISVSGTCLTVVNSSGSSFDVEATFQTLRCTRLGNLKPGDSVNLERALRLSDRLGGHLVTGHVDGLAQVDAIEQEGFAKLVTFSAAGELARFFVEKGSVAIEGVSLTVARLGDLPTGKLTNQRTMSQRFTFTVALIPHTMNVTTLGLLKVGDLVNVEADLIAKYVARLVAPALGKNINKASLSLSFLSEHGYT